MQPKKLLPVAATAASMPQQADGQLPPSTEFARGNRYNATYGPLKAIEFPGDAHKVNFTPYPDFIPAENRINVTNGGLGIVCSSCNATGCLCPDNMDAIRRICEGCQGTAGGGVRCYCDPRLRASPCNTQTPPTISCDDGFAPRPVCENVPQTFFCEPNPWQQNPDLKFWESLGPDQANNVVSAFVYGFGAIEVKPGANVTEMVEKQAKGQAAPPMVIIPDYQEQSVQVVQPQQVPTGKGSKNTARTGAAVAAAAAGATFMMSQVSLTTSLAISLFYLLDKQTTKISLSIPANVKTKTLLPDGIAAAIQPQQAQSQQPTDDMILYGSLRINHFTGYFRTIHFKEHPDVDSNTCGSCNSTS
ncbi:MAG: hypothetical protein Q9166_002146 [cf. Caloplaca sp. 2 TL-2023]